MHLHTLEALAFGDREAALRQLVPGSEASDTFRVLRHQHRGELDAAEPILSAWAGRHGSTATLRQLALRQAVLRADRDLEGTADEGARAFGLAFEHARRATHAPAEAPTSWSLPPARELVRLGRSADRGLRGLTDVGLRHAPIAIERAVHLSRLAWGGVAGLVDAIAAHLGEKDGPPFGKLAIHRALLLPELEALADRSPRLRADREWVIERLRRLRPPEPVDLATDAAARDAWLARAWGEVHTLPLAAFVDLQAQVLLQQLASDRLQDRTDEARVRAYLDLPRRTSPASQLARHPRDVVAKLEAAWSDALGLPDLRSDEELVRHHVGELLRRGVDPASLHGGLEPAVVDRWHAEEVLLHGLPEREAAARRLGSVAALQDRVDVDILPHHPRSFGRDEEVAVDVAVKNAGPLSVRVFRVDVAGVFAATQAAVPADLDVEGLRPLAERTVPAPHEDPLRRVRLRLALPEIDRAGTWLVDLEGNGRVTRLLVTRGDLRAVARTCAGGVEVRVFDERGRPCPGARVVVGTTAHAPHDGGAVLLPFGVGSTPVLLLDGDLAVVTHLHLPGEVARLGLSAHLDRAAAVPGASAPVLVRTWLTLAGAPVSLSLLEDAWVEVSTRDRTGVPATRREPLNAEDGEELVVSVPVPEHLVALSIAVGGRVRVRSEQRHEVVTARVDLSLGDRAGTDDTAAPFLVPGPDGLEVHLLGRCGEPVGGRELSVSLTHAWLRDPLAIRIATDALGRARLGPLPGVTGLRVEGPSAGPAHFPLGVAEVPGPTVVFAGEPVQLPWEGPFRVVEHRGGAPAHARDEHAVLGEGTLTLQGLAPGRYFVEGDERRVLVLVVPGERPAGEDAVSLAPRRHVTVPGRPPVLAEAAFDGDRLRLRVDAPSDDTRLHVWLCPFAPDWAGDPGLGAEGGGFRLEAHGPAETVVLPARALGDEARYVRERRRLGGRPGSLLERPSLLLSPWSLRTTQTAQQPARPGAPWAQAAPAPAAERYAGLGAGGAAPSDDGPVRAELGPWWDHLGAPSVLCANLRPGPDGRVDVELPGSWVRVASILVVDPAGHRRAERVRAAVPAPPRDRRLPAALPPEHHFVEARRLTDRPSGGRSVRIDSLEAVWRALCALSGDPTLSSWDFLPRWATLPRAARLDRWNEHACHELAVFVALRDRELLDQVVRPFVQNKLQPDLVDDWVAGRSLDRWLAPWRLARLDAVERALLAQARPDARARLHRMLADEVELERPDPSIDDRLVDVFLGGSGGSPPPDAPDLDGVLAESADEEPAEPAPRQRNEPGRPPPPKRKAAKADADRRPTVEERWRPADLTREWAEHQWWRTPLAQRGPGRVRASRWWRDLAGHAGGPFRSPHLADAARSFSESVVALAVIGVPGDATGALHAEASLSPARAAPTGTVLVGQHWVRADDRTVWDGGEEREKHVGDEVSTRVVYTSVVAVTNPTSRRRRLGVLVQIPEGAVAVGGAPATRTTPLDLGPWATSTLETRFYFPHAGRFRCYGARVADGEAVAAAAPDRHVHVEDARAGGDDDSWAWVSQEAPLEAVVAWLGRANPRRVDLSDLAWRMRDREAFDALTAAMADRGLFDEACWRYAWVHRDRPRLGEWLDRHPEVVALGPLRSGLVSVDPTDRGLEEHLEYAPLVNARAHTLGAERRIPNEGQDAHWRAFLRQVAVADAPTAEDRLRAAHHLFAMDRPDEAAALLATVDVGGGPAGLQRSWLAAHERSLAGDWDAVRRLVAPHLEHPVPRWRRRFRALQGLADEVAGHAAAAADPDRRDERLAELASRAPALAVRLEGSELLVDHAHLASVELRVHDLDVELSFSRQPFAGAGGDRFGWLEPRTTRTIPLSAGPTTRWPLPDDVRSRDAALEVVAGPLRRSVLHLTTELAVTPIAAYGQLVVTRRGAPVSGAYVKVFARYRGGGVGFYKDGYTDPLGRFDHATLSTDDVSRTERFSVLVVKEGAGAVLLEVDPPTR